MQKRNAGRDRVLCAHTDNCKLSAPVITSFAGRDRVFYTHMEVVTACCTHIRTHIKLSVPVLRRHITLSRPVQDVSRTHRGRHKAVSSVGGRQHLVFFVY